MKLIYFMTEDAAFCSHRLHMAVAAQKAGFKVSVITQIRNHGKVIEDAGIRVIPLEINRGSVNVIADIKVIRQLIKIYKQEKPDILHHITLKPILYGTFAARIAKIKHVVNALTGLGYTFTAQSLKARLIRPWIKGALRKIFKNSGNHLIVQNNDDYHLMRQYFGADEKRTHLVKSSGVNIYHYLPSEEPSGIPRVVLPARILIDKGIREFVAAARILHKRDIKVKMILVGGTDNNPNSISEAEINNLVREGLIEWWGHRENMVEVFAESTIVCLPSYREGVPKVLLEAGASKRVLIATDVPGCREIVRHNENGLLVPVRNATALADAIIFLLQNPELRLQLAAKSREIVVAEFADNIIAQQILNVYYITLGILDKK